MLMHTINLFSRTVLASSILMLSSFVFASEHDMMDMSHMNHADMQMDDSSMDMPHDEQHISHAETAKKGQEKAQSSLTEMHNISMPEQLPFPAGTKLEQYTSETQHKSHAMQDHMKDHGGQIYQSTSFENKWMLNDTGRGALQSKLKTWIGTDENKLFIEAHLEKAESSREHYDISALYSRNVAEFWDVQAGARYRQDQRKISEKQQVDVQFGIRGLAPYFFETEAYLYVGKDSQVSMSLELERDILITQKLITQPYMDATMIISDDSKYAKKTGLSSLQAGIQTRYEINKKVMPFIDLAYSYENGDKHTAWQTSTKSESGFVYGAGVIFKF